MGLMSRPTVPNREPIVSTFTTLIMLGDPQCGSDYRTPLWGGGGGGRGGGGGGGEERGQ